MKIQKRDKIYSLYVNKFSRWWLTGILIFLPFQRRISKSIVLLSEKVALFINYLDEITIVIFLVILTVQCFKSRRLHEKLPFVFLIPISVLCLSGLVSGIINGNSFSLTILGTADYVKNLLVIFIYAAFFKENDDFKTAFKLVIWTALIIGIFAIVQEVWALVARYCFGKSFADMGGGIYGREIVSESSWRFGLYRARSLMHNPVIMGQYSLIIATVYLFISKNICRNRKKCFAIYSILLLTGIASISRMVYAGLALLAVSLIVGRKKWVMIVMFITIITLSIVDAYQGWRGIKNENPTFDYSEIMAGQFAKEEIERKSQNTITYREYNREKGIEIWKDNPFFGIGPGMYGGRLSILINSPVYSDYNITITRGYLSKWGGIDQFWPQILAEVGIFGTGSFIILYFSIFIYLLVSAERRSSDEIRGLLMGLATCSIIILIYMTGSGFNITSVVFTFAAFTGIGIGNNAK